jgi:RNA polymerase sigma factor (TIGR02999 family)
MAGRFLRGEKAGHTLQATDLVHEAYERLIDTEIDWQDRAHFLAVAAQMMRRILVDHARTKRRVKRGGDNVKVTLNEAALVSDQPSADILSLDEAITALSDFDPRKGKVLELYFFGGLTYDEIAQLLQISPATVDRELRVAKAWVCQHVEGDTAPDQSS